MTICVHLTSEKNLSLIRRSGIKAQPLRQGERGIYCMPLLPDFYVSHQWLRELKRGKEHNSIIAVDFRLPKEEIVLVGHYAAPHIECTIGEAARVILNAKDPLGFEILLPRSIQTDEIHKVRNISQVTGWRYSPKAKGTKPFCTCQFCIGGDWGADRLRKRLAEMR